MHKGRRVGVVSMMRNGRVLPAIRKCFSALGCKLEIYKYDNPRLFEIIKDSTSPSHWFFTGNGPDFVTDENAPAIDERIYGLRNKMMYFACYSHQLIAHVAGCVIWQAAELFDGDCQIKHVAADPIFAGVPADARFAIYHRQYIKKDCKPPGWKILALCNNKGTEYIAYMKHGRNMYATQVHAEFLRGTYKVIENWLNATANQSSV